MNPHIHFTTEDVRGDGSIPFLDTLVMPQPNNFLLHLCTGSQHTQIYTCNGTAITI